MTNTLNSISLRPIVETDMPVLREIYYASRAEEMTFFPFNDEQKLQFLASQFDAQHSHYQAYYGQAQYDCVLLDSTVIGRLYVDRGAEDMRIIDINILPAYCNRGIGTFLLQQLIAEADAKQLSLSAHVEHNNPARRLYARLGFDEVENREVYIFIVRQSANTKPAQASNQTKLADKVSSTAF